MIKAKQEKHLGVIGLYPLFHYSEENRRVTIATSQLQHTATSELHAQNRLRATCGDVISSCGWPRCPYKEDRESVIRAMAGDLDTSDHPWSAYFVSKSDSDSSIYSGFCIPWKKQRKLSANFHTRAIPPMSWRKPLVIWEMVSLFLQGSSSRVMWLCVAKPLSWMFQPAPVGTKNILL